MNIILVDDEQKFATMLAKRLELRGIDATVFFSGDEALGAVEKGGRFDVALLDVKMPGIGGIELRRKLQALDPRMKFVFLTGHGSDADYQVGVKEADGYLPKPLKIEDLIGLLNRLE
jgi:two-component system, OmpR family, response regulator